MQTKEELNLADTIKGEINRMCVTNDIAELDTMALHARRNIERLQSLRYASITADTPQTDEIGDCNSCEYLGDLRCGMCTNGSGYRRRADTPQTEETCERCVYVRGSQWCQGCNGTPKRWDGEKIVDTPQTESTGSPIGDYRDGVGAWQTDRMTEEEIDTMLAKALVGQTDCSWMRYEE